LITKDLPYEGAFTTISIASLRKGKGVKLQVGDGHRPNTRGITPSADDCDVASYGLHHAGESTEENNIVNLNHTNNIKVKWSKVKFYFIYFQNLFATKRNNYPLPFK
jgi:hypothetical protein